MAPRPPKRPIGTERRRAPNVTHTDISETRAPEVWENVTYFEHRVKWGKLVPEQDAPNVTHTDIPETSEPLRTSYCVKIVASFATSPKWSRPALTWKHWNFIGNMYENEICKKCVNIHGSQLLKEFDAKSKMLLKPLVGAPFLKDALEQQVNMLKIIGNNNHFEPRRIAMCTKYGKS